MLCIHAQTSIKVTYKWEWHPEARKATLAGGNWDWRKREAEGVGAGNSILDTFLLFAFAISKFETILPYHVELKHYKTKVL